MNSPSNIAGPLEKIPCGTSAVVPNKLGADAIPPHLTLSPRVRLVTLSTACAAKGADAEAVIRMVDEATDSRHIRFAFDVGMGGNRRDLRFYVDELIAPAMVRNFTIQDAIVRILGGRPAFRRSELEIAWTISATHVGRLIDVNILKSERARLMRPVLEAFLLTRWSGNNPN